MRIVQMERDHIEQIAELEEQCFSRPWSRQALEEELENPTACFLAAVEGTDVLGYGGMHCAFGECYMDNLAVFGSKRRQGVGTALLRALLKEAARRGGEFLSLEVRPSNLPAGALYRKLGFLEEGRRKNFYTAPREDALILTKRFEKEEAGSHASAGN